MKALIYWKQGQAFVDIRSDDGSPCSEELTVICVHAMAMSFDMYVDGVPPQWYCTVQCDGFQPFDIPAFGVDEPSGTM